MVRFLALAIIFCSFIFTKAQNLSTVIQTGHSDRITAMQFSQDSNYLLTASMDETIVVWDVKNQVQVNVLSGFSGGVSCFVYNQPQKLLVVGTYDNQVKIYNEDTSLNEPIIQYEFTSYVTSVAVSPNGKLIAAASADYSVSLFENGTSRQLLLGDEVTGMVFANDNSTLCLGNYNNKIYALDTRESDLNNGLYILYKADESISFITISPDRHKWGRRKTRRNWHFRC